MNNAVICDLDGTLIENPDWDGDLEKFYRNILDGFPIEWCEFLVNILAEKKIKILFITARDEKCRSMTIAQLNRWFDFPYELYMRKNGDLRPDFEVKRDYTIELKEKYNILFAIDDNVNNCIMFRNNGITSLLVNEAK